jgi:Protein of unknown function (DUF1761)
MAKKFMAINFMALFAAALVPMIIGFIWYHPKVLGTIWQQQAGVSDDKLKTANMPLMLGLSFVFALLLAMGMNVIAYHDAFVHGALYYVINGASEPPAGSEAAKWLDYYTTNLSATCRTFKHGAAHGFLIAGIFVVLPTIATSAIFERKSWKYILVNAGYWIVTLILMGGIIAAWK